MEGSFAKTLPALLIEEAKDTKFYTMSDGMARWLGRLAVVAQWDWTREIESSDIQTLDSLVEEFNKRYQFT